MRRNLHLLVIDDELDELVGDSIETRRSFYQKLGEKFEVSFLDDPGELHDVLKRQKFDGLLVDFVLDGWGMDARAIVRQVGKSIPITLISKSWSSNFRELSDTIASFPIARLFTWDEMLTAQSRELLAFWIKTAISQHRGIHEISNDANESLRLVHFSDMQFNANNNLTHQTDTQIAIQEIQTHWQGVPHFLALTGDIAEAGRPLEYDMALRWVEALNDRLSQGGRSLQILTVPGNHDVSWPLALAQRLDAPNKSLKDGAPLQPDLARYAFAPFREFSRGVEPSERWSGTRNYWVSGAFRDEGLILFGINSSENLDQNGLPTRELDDQTMADLFAEVCALKKDTPGALVVGLMHHRLDASEEGIVNATSFKRNISAATGSIVLLTGHMHEESSTLTHETSKPSILHVGSSTYMLTASKRPEDSLRGFNLIEFERSEGLVTGIRVDTYAIVGNQLRPLSSTPYRRDQSGVILRSTL